MHTFLTVGVEFVDVLAKQHGSGPKRKYQAQPRHLIAPRARDDVVGATHHEWAPYEQHGGLSKADSLEWPGVEQDEKGTGEEQRKRGAAARSHQPQAQRQRHPRGKGKITPELRFAHQPVFEYMYAVLIAVIVAAVNASARIGVVVEQVVAGMGKQQPGGAG